jgi:hypothetical protein
MGGGGVGGGPAGGGRKGRGIAFGGVAEDEGMYGWVTAAAMTGCMLAERCRMPRASWAHTVCCCSWSLHSHALLALNTLLLAALLLQDLANPLLTNVEY